MENIKEVKYNNFVWIDVVEPRKDQLEKIAAENNLDYLQIIDTLEHGHLPKFETITEYSFIILRAYTAGRNDKFSTVGELTNKIAFFYNDHKLITIHRASFDFIKDINQDFTNSSLLLLHIVFKMIQTYIQPSNWHSYGVDEVEKEIFLHDYSKVSLEDLYFQKSQTRIIKKLLQITQDVVNKIHVDKEALPILQDVKDRILYLILIYDEVAEDTHNLMHTYLSLVATKNNDVMRLLTIFSAFFLPLTFLVGLYGMNFTYMPEIQWKYGYLFAVILMVVICIIIFYWFKRKKII
jgi:magnesium transporter